MPIAAHNRQCGPAVNSAAKGGANGVWPLQTLAVASNSGAATARDAATSPMPRAADTAMPR